MPLKDWRKLLLPSSLSALAGYCDDLDELTRGNSLKLLQDGKEAYPAMLAAIAAAKETVHLETYILRDDRTGWTFAKALDERSRAGVEVRVIFDGVGSLGLSDRYVQNLRNGGISVLEYRPVAPWRSRWGWDKRNHRKILAVDGRIAFTGGINIADEYADPAQGGAGWRDTHVRLEGPAAYELDRLFRATWYRETRRYFRLRGSPEPKAAGAGTSLVRVAANQEFIKRHLIRRAYLHAIRRAERRILISASYFIPDRGVRIALYRARGRGVQVSVLVPAVSDVPAVDYAGRYLYPRHLDRGLKLYAWPGPTLHSKTMVVDGVWSALGSYNFTHRSLHHNLEINVHVLDKGFSGELEASLLSDIARSTEITRKMLERRPWADRLLERFFYLLRYWF